MSVKQISVSLENVPGMFLAVSERLGAEGINIRAISVADTSDMSTVRFVSDDPEQQKKRTDGEMFYIITKGHGRMPADGERFEETWRWDLVNAIRTLRRTK